MSRNPSDERPLAEGPCNHLYALENARLNCSIAWAVRLTGNWVGGVVRLYPDRVVFEMNERNAAFQADRRLRVIPAGEVTGASEGRAFLGIGRTVDLHTASGLARFRCSAANRRAIAEAAARWAGTNDAA